MKPIYKPLLLAGLISVAVTAMAQPGPGAGGPGPASPEVRERIQERMQRNIDRRTTDLKAKLKLSAEQEGAWASYIASMKPPAFAAHPSRADMDKLTTPERLDTMRAWRKQREVEMDKRDDATRAFYATLSDEQKKIFDANTGRPDGRRRPR